MSEERMKIVRAMATMAWSDGRMDKVEKEKLRVLAQRMGLDAGELSKVEGFLMSRPSIDGMTFEGLNDKERHALFLMAVHYAYMDGVAHAGEIRVLDQLAEKLGIAPDQRVVMENQVRAQKGK